MTIKATPIVFSFVQMLRKEIVESYRELREESHWGFQDGFQKQQELNHDL